MLYSDSAGCYLLGCLCNEPHLLRSGKYPLTVKDFSPNLLHRHLFAVINNLAFKGLQEITEIEIDQFIQPYPLTKDVVYDKDGLEFIRIVKQQANSGNIDLYYPIIRKFSLLRKAQELGEDITDVYDDHKSSESQLANLNKYSVTDLIDHFDTRIIELKKEFHTGHIRQESWVGEDIDKLLTQFEQEPAIGAGLCSPYETTLYRGFQQGHLIMRSGGSGFGKTTRAVGDICNICCPYLWDSETKQFVKNKNFQGKGFYIHTESKQREELQPKFMSYICDIPYHTILDGKFSAEERKRIIDGSDLIKDHIKLIDLPDFTIPLLKDTIHEVSVVDKCTHGVFDYVQDNSIVGKVLKNETGTSLRQDMVLVAIATNLKTFAETYNVGILTMTQLNGNEKVNTLIDEGCIFGSKMMKAKLDSGSIILAPRKPEIDQTQSLGIKRGHFGKGSEVNMVSHVYKARFSKYGQNLKIYQHIDLSTGRLEDLYVTNLYNEPVHVEKTYVTRKEVK